MLEITTVYLRRMLLLQNIALQVRANLPLVAL